MNEEIVYQAQDCADALIKLCETVGEKPISFPEGSPQWSSQDIQQHWAVVAHYAGATGTGALPEDACGSLKAIFNYVETIIISCGAPDSFTVYEVCFETLTKMGFYVHGTACKELLFRVLEEVHEVYDVLLSCVETYEWVQPGATGSLRLWMLQVIFASFGAGNLTGRHLMELTDNDVSGAVSLISFLLRCEQAPFLMQDAAGRCLVELTTADSVFLQREGGLEDTQNEQISKLTAMLNRHVNGLIKGIIQFDIVEGFGRCICQHQMSHSRTDIVVKHFLTTIHNCLLYCSENQKKLRQHLATQSTIVQDIMIPYVHNILPALEDHPNCGPALLEWQNLKAALQTFIVVSFNINVFRPQLRDTDMLMRVCKVPKMLENITMIELVVKLCINVDFVKGEWGEALTQTLENAFNHLVATNPENAIRLQRRLTSEQSTRLPYSKSADKAIEALAFMLQAPPGEESREPDAVEGRKVAKKQKWRNAKNKSKKRKRLFAMQGTGAKSQAESAAAEAGQEGDDEEEDDDEDDDDDDMPPLIAADGWEATLGRTDEAGVPENAVCKLSGALMHDPVATPEGHVFDRAALEDYVAGTGANPVTGAAMSMEQCTPATEIGSLIQGFQMQMFSACQIAPDAFDKPEVPTVEAPIPSLEAGPRSEAPAAPPPMPPKAPVMTGPSLLGDLPALEKEKTEKQERKKEKTKISIPSRSVVECPEEMRCQIDGKVCVNPVRSIYGHLFEKKTLDRWIQNCGSVCPITSKPLRAEECEPDSEMKKRIIKFLKKEM